MQNTIERSMYAFIITALIVGLTIPLYFAYVLYNHYKNSEKPVNEGGA